MPSSVHSFVWFVPETLQRGVLYILPDNQNLVVAKTSTWSNMVRRNYSCRLRKVRKLQVMKGNNCGKHRADEEQIDIPYTKMIPKKEKK